MVTLLCRNSYKIYSTGFNSAEYNIFSLIKNWSCDHRDVLRPKKVNDYDDVDDNDVQELALINRTKRQSTIIVKKDVELISIDIEVLACLNSLRPGFPDHN